MQTLLLTSAGMEVKDEILKLLTKPASEIRLAHIVTASNVEEDKTYLIRDRQRLIETGFQMTEIDIEGMSEKEVRTALGGVDVVYVQGGNTFHLLHCTRESGFERIVKELIGSGVMYIGVSAGSIIMSPSIEMATWNLKSMPADKDLVGLSDLTGLGIVPFLIHVHYKPEDVELVRKATRQCRFPVRILTDQQAFLVKNGETVLVGAGPEIKV